MTLAIVDMGISNIRSIEHAFDRLGIAWNLAASSDDIEKAAAIVLPGVGAFPDGMASLAGRGLVGPLRDHALKAKKPLLGICLGMQLMAQVGMEHERTEGLGLIPGRVVRLEPGPGERVPNIGWCSVVAKPVSRLMKSVPDDTTFYFVHSYHFECADVGHVAAEMPFGAGKVAAAVENGVMFAFQFHPEKSQDVGMDLLDSFVRIAGLRA